MARTRACVLGALSLAAIVSARRVDEQEKSLGPGTAPHMGVSGAEEWWLGASPGSPPSGPMYAGQPLDEYLGLHNWTSPMHRVSCKKAFWNQRDQCMTTVIGHACGHDASTVCSSLSWDENCNQPPGRLSSTCLYCLAVAKDPSIQQRAAKLGAKPTADACENLAEKGYRKTYSNALYGKDDNLAAFVAATPGLTLEAATDACGNEDDLTCKETAPEECGFCDDVFAERQDCQIAMGLAEHLQTYNWFGSGWFGQSYCDGVKDQLDKGKIAAADHHPATLRCYGLRRLVMQEIERSQNFLINTKEPTTRLLQWVCKK